MSLTETRIAADLETARAAAAECVEGIREARQQLRDAQAKLSEARRVVHRHSQRLRRLSTTKEKSLNE